MSDRLAALSGIAKAYERSTGKVYLAENWKEELLSQLSWRRIGKAATTLSHDQPSWSWVKMNGRTRFRTVLRPSDREAAVCSLLDVRVERNQSLNRFDNFARIEIDLRGHFLRVQYKEVPDDDFGFSDLSIFTTGDQQLGSFVSDFSHPKCFENTELHYILLQSGTHASGIVVVRTPGSEQIYQRVGLFTGHTRIDESRKYIAAEQFLSAEQTTLTIV